MLLNIDDDDCPLINKMRGKISVHIMLVAQGGGDIKK